MGINSKKETNKNTRKEQKEKRVKYRIRMFPIWLRVIVVLLLSVVALMLGLMFGYGVLGDGNATDILKKETWQHIVDIVKKEK